MLSKKFITGIAIALIIYGSAVGFWAWLNHTELYSIAVCCGLYGDYELYYLPLPIAISSALSDWDGGTTKINMVNVLLDILLLLTVVPGVGVLLPRILLNMRAKDSET